MSGARGSVIPIFNAQIRKGGPVTVTHPDMVRYFMTIPEAAQLVIQAWGMPVNGRIYVLDMGEPVRIVEMARDLIRLSGLEPDRDVKIEFTEVRAGEKLFEGLLAAEEGTTMSQHESIHVANTHPLDGMEEEEFDQALNGLLDVAARRDVRDDGSAAVLHHELRDAIHRLVPTYSGVDRSALQSQGAS